MGNINKLSMKFGVSEYTVKSWINEGRLKCSVIDGEIVFEDKEIERFIKATGIEIIKPGEFNKFIDKEINNVDDTMSLKEKYEQLHNEYCRTHNVMTPEEIVSLVSEVID
ncbi:helix-turn-helix domain-containing protein [Oceanirhabdus sp. W0125-5]|uniref:helix-turn-helix domain-containing protein n=1 Tax=Oceanirhabdus sp. W0125-5 TaxID=2999116 RepID=UPI0022F3377E|nr:helix-turn-helix domain-containing protein [Oceanirhabdus sp. W0125-5]WBW97326.1 helix-turn-helix domain-containing protein [Oceanirhabdus sp. W0125-5]